MSTNDLIDAILQLSQSRDIAAVQAVVTSAARKLSGADGATFILKDGEHCYYADEYAIAPLWKGQRFPLSSCIGGWCMQHKEPVIIEDIANDERIRHSAYTATFVTSLAMVPVRTDAPVAAIGVYWSTKHTPSATEIQLLQTLANSTSIAMNNVQLYEQLNKRVLERTAKLYASQQQAEASNAVKSRFLAAASHDLRQPLQQLSNLSGILARGVQDPSMRQHIKKMQHVIVGTETLLSNLLDLNQLESGALKPELDDIMLNSLLNELRNDFQDAAAAKSLTLTIPVCHQRIHSDPALLLQILRNLLSNAIKYTDTGSVELECKNNGNSTEICIHDSGLGIAIEQQQNIFAAFCQLASTHPRKQVHGFGLGLSIVQGLSELLNHPLNLQSKIGKGSTFSVTVPHSANAHETIVANSPSLLTTDVLHKANVLYLEDDEDLAESVETLLNLEGYQVFTTDNCDTALAWLKTEKHAPDLIITDNHLQNGESGLQIVQAIRQNSGRNVPAIMLTGRTEQAIHNEAKETVQKVFCKPVDADQLLHQIDLLLQQQAPV